MPVSHNLPLRNDVTVGIWYRCHRRAVGLRPPPHHEWWGQGRPQGSPLRAEVRKRPPREGWPYGCSVGNAVPGVPQNIPNQPLHPGESAPTSHLHCHCEAEGRGNLLRDCANPNDVPGDCHGATPLAMTQKIEPGASAYGAVRPPREGWPYRWSVGKMSTDF